MRYFDHASVSPPHPAAIKALSGGPWADPSRLYASARTARQALDTARAFCAASIGARAEEITFTSGGTEALVLAAQGAARAAIAARRPKRIVVSEIEQRSLLDTFEALEDFEIVTVAPDHHGRIHPDRVALAVADGAALVAVQVANGEIGTTQPISDIAQAIGKAWLLCDASFAAGWSELDVRGMGAHLVAVSGSRCGGVAGTGFLWAKPGVRLRPMLKGDDRERGVRAGLQNVAALSALGAGLAARTGELSELSPRLASLTQRLIDELPKRLSDVLIHGDPTHRLPHIVSFSIPLVEGEALLLGLDAAGFAVHSGSACSSSTNEPSHVLAAIETLTHGAIRVSIGPECVRDDIDDFLQALPEIVAKARATLGNR